MTENKPEGKGLLLRGLDGSNPLAFLAAVGTLITVSNAQRENHVEMHWQQNSGGWRPVLKAASQTPSTISKSVASFLKCGFQPDTALERARDERQKSYQEIRKAIKKKKDEIRDRKLEREERKSVEEAELQPLLEKANQTRDEWLDVLARVVPFPEMSLGKHLDATRDEYREAAQNMLEETNVSTREHVDMVASFASDACFDKKTFRVQATPICFVTGSGHQYFLDTARQLITKVDEQQIHDALFKEPAFKDEKLSMRWDPIEDRRYALMWSDPSSLAAMTNWALNLLAYRGLQLFASFPTPFGLRTTCFDRTRYFTWPIWECSLTVHVLRSLLNSPLLLGGADDFRKIAACGVRAVFRSERLVVGNPPLHKINFSPATAVM